MRLVRLTSNDDPRYRWAMTLYGNSFPLHEQRLEPDQRQIMGEEGYHFELLCEENDWVGILLYWEREEFIYVEHFCTMPAVRGKGYGQAALDLLAQKGKRIILEIDPPVSELNQRRKGFYERAGFSESSFTHVHPPYRRQYRGHGLTVMSRPGNLSEGDYQAFATYLNQTVMKYAE